MLRLAVEPIHDLFKGYKLFFWIFFALAVYMLTPLLNGLGIVGEITLMGVLNAFWKLYLPLWIIGIINWSISDKNRSIRSKIEISGTFTNGAGETRKLRK